MDAVEPATTQTITWSLTHAHATIVAPGAGVMILLIDVVFIINTLIFPHSIKPGIIGAGPDCAGII